MNGTRTISLPEELCARSEQKFRHRFASIDQLVAALLSELLRADAVTMDKNEQKVIEERLKGLGYI